MGGNCVKLDILTLNGGLVKLTRAIRELPAHRQPFTFDRSKSSLTLSEKGAFLRPLRSMA